MSLRKKFSAYKKMKDKCDNLVKQSMKKYVKDITKKRIATSKTFRNTFQTLVTDKIVEAKENIYLSREKLKRR